MSPVRLDRADTGAIEGAMHREWLVTNGIGGFASGTVANMLTRRYHGLLMAALQPPLGRTLLVTKVDDTAFYREREYPLFANLWGSGVLQADCLQSIESFHLEGTTPVWQYAFSDALLEKRIWMEQGANITYVEYRLRHSSSPLRVTGKVLVNYRDYHGTTYADGWQMATRSLENGIEVTAYEGATPFYLLSSQATAARLTSNRATKWSQEHSWFRGFLLDVERYRGLECWEDHLHIGTFEATLEQGSSLTIVAGTSQYADQNAEDAYFRQKAHESALQRKAARYVLAENGHASDELAPLTSSGATKLAENAQQLILAADQFVVDRALPGGFHGKTIIAGYHWFSDWGRDTMIALPGLALSTGRAGVAYQILRTFADTVSDGMLPNRFPDSGEIPEYNTVDATLWYIEAIRAYYAETGDLDLVRQLFPVLTTIVDWHCNGTRTSIRRDPADGLLHAGEAGTQLTWMDARVGDWVVTPRIGKPVEVNALWYNGLRTMSAFALLLGWPREEYEQLAEEAEIGFERFWNEELGYCYDVLDGPDGHEVKLRPNQLFAVSLHYSPLSAAQQKSIVDVCAKHLLTSHGLRSLAPEDPDYLGHYGGDPGRRDAAYHQGTVWAWLMGPFISAHLRVYKDPMAARSFLEPLLSEVNDHGLGTISEIFDGDPPYTPRGAIAQAWSVAEVLRIWSNIARYTPNTESKQEGEAAE